MKTQTRYKMSAGQRIAAWLLLALSCLSVVGLYLYGPIAQDLQYHEFADQRTVFGVSNFWDVVSNLPLFVIGIAGLFISVKLHPHSRIVNTKIFYQLFFLGIMLTGLTSSYYHLEPNNVGLFWDRLTMALSFAALMGLVIGEFISHRLAHKLKIPLVVFGLFSVVYWIGTELSGAGDLRPYILTQFLPMLLIPIIAIFWSSEVIRKSDVAIIALFYGVAKLLELGDHQLYHLTSLSGHTLKHLAAAASTFWVYRILHRNR